MQIRKRGGQPGNKNAAGHASSVPKGNRNAAGHRVSVPRGNMNAVKHGLNSKRILSDHDTELFRSGMDLRLTDILWECIRLQHAAIIRAQKIMYVADPHDHTRELTGQSSGKTLQTYKYEIQIAQDKQAAFLEVQSTAMAVLRTMIELYDRLTHGNRELIELDRQLRILRMRAWIEKYSPDLEIDHGEDDFIWAMVTKEGRS